jgi:mycothiol synthase
LTAQGEAAGFGVVFANPEPLEKRQAYLELYVHPDYRGGGLDAYFFGRLERFGRRKLADIGGDLPAALRTGVEDSLEARLALVEKSGFRPVRYFYRMRRDLRRPIDSYNLPEGLTLRQYTTADELPLLEAFNESFADHWNFEPATIEDWQTWVVRTKEFRPEFSYLALDGEEIAGFLVSEVRGEENRRHGTNQSWIGELGTRRPYRRRGIASALLSISLHAFQAAGLDYAILGVDTENPTGALGLYERLSFEPIRRFISFEKLVL